MSCYLIKKQSKSGEWEPALVMKSWICNCGRGRKTQEDSKPPDIQQQSYQLPDIFKTLETMFLLSFFLICHAFCIILYLLNIV